MGEFYSRYMIVSFGCGPQWWLLRHEKLFQNSRFQGTKGTPLRPKKGYSTKTEHYFVRKIYRAISKEQLFPLKSSHHNRNEP